MAKKKGKITPKQEAVIREIVKDVREGKKFSPANATEKIYNVSSKQSAYSIASKNLRNENFREALMLALEERNIIGANSKIEKVLTEGLDAENKDGIDYRVRLDYAKEINKISGVYAPEKHETKHMNLNLNMTKEELDDRIKSLKDELEDL